jgi:hypothetical protein
MTDPASRGSGVGTVRAGLGRVANGAVAVARDRDTRFVVGHFVLSRAIYLVSGVLTGMLVAADAGVGATPSGSVPIAALLGTAGDALGRLVMHGDGYWYLGLMRDGYAPGPFTPDVRNNWPFFPFFPMVAGLVGGSVLGGVLLASGAALVAARLLMAEVGLHGGRRAGRWTVLLLLYWPFSNMLSSFRPESLILLASVGAWMLARRRRWWAAWACVAVAALCRPPGLLVGVLVLGEAISAERAVPRRLVGAVAGAILPLAGIALFSVYQGIVVGEPLAWYKAQAAWGRSADLLATLRAYWTHPLFVRWTFDFAIVNWAILALLLGAAVLLARRGLWPLAAFTAAYSIMPLLTGNLIASGRYASTMFPAAIVGATDRLIRPVRLGILVVSAALLAAVGAWTVLELAPILP